MSLARSAALTGAFSILLWKAFAVPLQELPEGEGKDSTERACSACHDLVVVTAERHTETQWKALVDDMVRRGAEASDAEKKAILGYLVKNFGK